MFLLTQFIGLYVLTIDPLNIEINVNGTMQTVSNQQLAFLQPQEGSPLFIFGNIIFAFMLAILLLFFLIKLGFEKVLKLWFFTVVVIALWLVFYSFEIAVPFIINPTLALIIPLLIALPLSYIKIYKKIFIIHNLTELLIYPGIAIVFVSILSQWEAIINSIVIISLLILISIYDMWAVWHSGIMQKMAKYQIDKLNVFSGFFVPYISKSVKAKIKKMKKSKLKKKKIKVNVAILGGGDVIFPIITAGIMLKTFGFIPALFVILGATLGLTYLFFFSEKKKFYPAMPFITAGIFIGMILSYLVS